jgi:hypothetical protein
MTTRIFMLAGAVLVSAISANGKDPSFRANAQCEKLGCCRVAVERTATADPFAEDRFRMKYGRNSPVEDARQKIAAEQYATKMAVCALKHGCCRPSPEKAIRAEVAAPVADPGGEMRYRMKTGRNSPAEERRLAEVSKMATAENFGSAERAVECPPECCKR